jgi:hypothetical protein
MRVRISREVNGKHAWKPDKDFFARSMTLTAMILSYAVNQSLCWCLLHGIFGGFYVVYWAIKYSLLIQWITNRFMI